MEHAFEEEHSWLEASLGQSIIGQIDTCTMFSNVQLTIIFILFFI